MCDLTHFCVMWRMHMFNGTHSYVPWLIHTCLTPWYAWRDSFMCDVTKSCITRFIRTRDVTHSHTCRDWFMCVTWLIHMCNVTQLYVWYDCATWLIHMCDVTHPIAQVTLMCNVTHSYVWRDSFICVTWLIHMWHDSFISDHLIAHSCRWH